MLMKSLFVAGRGFGDVQMKCDNNEEKKMLVDVQQVGKVGGDHAR